MAALPLDARGAISKQEAALSERLAECGRIPDPASCRSEAMSVHSQRVSDILATTSVQGRGVGGGVMGGAARDCVGDSKADVEASCKDGKVEELRVPCTHCVDAFGTTTGGDCKVWVCVIKIDPASINP